MKKIILIKNLGSKQHYQKKASIGLFKCFCGNEFEETLSKIKRGKRKSCGCLKYKGGISKHPIYPLWANIKQRCYNKNAASYEWYFKRNIKVCDEWINNSSAFIQWAEDNGYKKGLQIDRINPDGNYEPNNCRFVTPTVNSQNQSLKYRKNKVGYRNITLSRDLKRYEVNIMHKGKTYFIGSFKTIKEAIKSRNKWIIENQTNHPLIK